MESADPPSDSWTQQTVKSDIFALGTVLYELVTCAQVYPNMDRTAVRELILERKYLESDAIPFADTQQVIR